MLNELKFILIEDKEEEIEMILSRWNDFIDDNTKVKTKETKIISKIQFSLLAILY